MNIKTLLRLFSDKGCNKIYVKELSPNDNSKNQVYLGGSFDVLNILPIKEIITDSDGNWKRDRYKTRLDFYWINNEGILNQAPNAQLILYPKYPEVRFSGFLQGSKNAPSELMANRIAKRLLFLGVSGSAQIIGYVVGPESTLAKEFHSLTAAEEVGVFKALTVIGSKIEYDSKHKLLIELKRINELGWINSKRLDRERNILPCNSSNCGGYTLESELGITPNGYSEPDYLGWEVKQFGVKNFSKFKSTVITLMTPEPTHGFYVDKGVEYFIREYGYADKMGREHRMNFGGIHKYGIIEKTTGLKLIVDGYNAEDGKIDNLDGYVGLIDKKENIAASWSFPSLLKHWNTKHANACYIPSMNKKNEDEIYKKQYRYGSHVMLGNQTDFSFFLKQVSLGNIYYDPGIKLEFAIEGVRTQNIKRRSQFRIKANNLTNLYRQNEIIDLQKIV